MTMPLETDQWRELTTHQADFMKVQLTAAQQLAMGPAARETGIMSLATRQNPVVINGIGDARDEYTAVQWADPYSPDTECVLIARLEGEDGPSSFSRVRQTPTGFEMEGVGMRLIGASNCFGERVVRRDGVEDDRDTLDIGCEFFVAAMNRAIGGRKSVRSPGEYSVNKAIGVQGETIARLFRSLNTLNSRLIIAGVMGEAGIFTNQTYDVAQTLLRTTMSGIAESRSSEGHDSDSTLLCGASSRPIGAIFRSEHGGVTVIRRAGLFPSTIELTIFGRPNDGVMLAEQYDVLPGGVLFNTMVVRDEDYESRTVSDLMEMIGMNPEGTDAPLGTELDDDGNRLLEQRMIRLMSERSSVGSL